MTAYIINRLIQTVVVIFIVTIIAFLLVQLMPGDPAAAMLGADATQAQIENLRKELGLDQPALAQYFKWMSNAVRGDFGESLMYREPLISIFAKRLPVTLYLSSLAFIISTVLGVGAGIICAVRRNSLLDQLISLFANIGIAIPVFWLGILGIYVFGLKLELLPVYGWTSPLTDFGKSFSQSLMPVILLAVPSLAVMARQARSSMLEEVHQDYVRTALSKGLKERTVILKHSLKNALIPVVTLMGLHIRVLFGGAVLVETIFSIPGMGRLLVTAAQNKDFIVVQGSVLLLGLVVCLANLLVDMSYGWIDPRLRYE